MPLRFPAWPVMPMSSRQGEVSVGSVRRPSSAKRLVPLRSAGRILAPSALPQASPPNSCSTARPPYQFHLAPEVPVYLAPARRTRLVTASRS